MVGGPCGCTESIQNLNYRSDLSTFYSMFWEIVCVIERVLVESAPPLISMKMFFLWKTKRRGYRATWEWNATKASYVKTVHQQSDSNIHFPTTAATKWKIVIKASQVIISFFFFVQSWSSNVWRCCKRFTFPYLVCSWQVVLMITCVWKCKSGNFWEMFIFYGLLQINAWRKTRPLGYKIFIVSYWILFLLFSWQ